MGMALMASFLPEEGPALLNAVLLAGFAELVALPCISLWAGFGTAIGRLLNTERAWKIFNRVMGVLTASCVVMILG